jgi:hypothetical protein
MPHLNYGQRVADGGAPEQGEGGQGGVPTLSGNAATHRKTGTVVLVGASVWHAAIALAAAADSSRGSCAGVRPGYRCRAWPVPGRVRARQDPAAA